MSEIKKTRKTSKAKIPAIIKKLRTKLKVCLLDQKACSLDVDSCWIDKESQWYLLIFYSSADCDQRYFFDPDECFDYDGDIRYFLHYHYENMMTLEAALNSFDHPIINRYEGNLYSFYKLKECFYETYIKEVEEFIEEYGEWDETIYLLTQNPRP